uniref:Cytochrome P450 n=3 Tax=Timema TaxID=61471 RepID=A0A7R9IAM0_9NEOP|nr:unnamed protein product [Timema tahoe]
MEFVNLLLTLFLLLVPCVYLLKLGLRRARIVRLIDKLPGPRAYLLVGTILDVLVPRDKMMSVFNQRIEKYKPIFRTWLGPFPQVSITSPEYIEVILSTPKFLEKAYIYKFLHPWLGTGLLTSTETAMGTQINSQEDTESNYVSAVYGLGEELAYRMIRPWLHPDFIFLRTKRGKHFSQCLSVLHNFTDKIIQSRKVQLSDRTNMTQQDPHDESEILGQKRRQAFLDLLLQASINGQHLTDIELRNEVDTFMFEGHDTTTAAICWSLFLLGLNPHIQERVQTELDDLFQGSTRSVTMKDLQEMKYLEQVIKESLRLYPSVPFIARKIDQDVQLGEYTIPAGCTLYIPIYHVHRNPDYFPQPEEFNPDHFQTEKVQTRHPYAYIPFSAGPRNCIGQKFALLEEKTVLSSILRQFNVLSMQAKETVGMTLELVLRPIHGIDVQLRRRPNTSELSTK